MSLSPASIIHDVNGNAIGVVLDDTVYRLQVETIFKSGIVLQVSDSSVSEDPSEEVKERLLNGGSDEMGVDGSGTPVEFVFNADTTNDIKLFSLRFVMVANVIRINPNRFGPFSALTNGVKVEVRTSSVTTQIGILNATVDFLDFHGPTTQPFDRSGSDDLMIIQHNFGGTKLVAGSGDFVKITIQDDLSGASLDTFFASVAGVKV